MVYKSDITWSKIKKSVAPAISMKYCPSWAAAKKGSPEERCTKVGNRRSRRTGRSKEVPKNPVAPESVIEDVHENTAQMREFVELKLNQFEDSKDGLVGNA